MPLIPSNFAANSLSGTVRVSAGYANVVLPVSKYAFEDRTKTFTLKLRRDSAAGPVIAQSNLVTLTDFSEIVSLTANTSTVAEGNLVSFTLVTANVVNGANVFFSVLPVTANITTGDFFGANTGTVTINSNQGTFALFANADYSLVDETNETFKVQIRTVEPTGNIVFVSSNVAITDFFKRINVFRFEESSSSIVEGTSITFTVFAHNISPGTLLHYYTSGAAGISGSNTGSIAMNSVSNTITLTTASTVPGGETRTFNLILSESNLGAPIATSNTITVIDSSLAYLNATGGTVTTISGYRIHTFTSSNTFVVSNFSTAAFNTANILVIAGGGGGGRDYVDGRPGGGGGAGGFVYQTSIPLSASNTYNITIGAGGAASIPASGTVGANGSNTSLNAGGGFANILAVGGGGGGTWVSNSPGRNGGSGGGGYTAGSGYGFPSPTQQGFPGSSFQGHPQGLNWQGGGGADGAGVAGAPASWGVPAPATPGFAPFRRTATGGPGKISDITGSNVYYAGGGGGGTDGPNDAGIGGGGYSGLYQSVVPASRPLAGVGGNVNTGGGGGAGSAGPASPGALLDAGSGGSGIVIIRYAYLPPAFYTSVTANSSSIAEGSNAFFVINTTFANAAILYYDTVGNVTSSNFVNGNTGSFTVTSNATVLRLQTVGNIPNNETRNYQLRIREDSLTGNIVLVSSNVTIYDSNVIVYLNATGGNVTVSGGYKIHTFTESNNFVINSTSTEGSINNNLEILMVAGGGGGRPVSDSGGGGAGAGGLLYSNAFTITSAATYPIVIGAGGANSPSPGINNRGSNTTGFSAVALGGGPAGGGPRGGQAGGSPGGSGGGGSGFDGYTPAGSAIQGNYGVFVGYGNAGGVTSGGGGGASQAGTPNTGKGGDGRYYTISGANVAYAGGGGGGAGGAGGAGGGAAGSTASPGNNGNVNTGGGAGGNYSGGALTGGSGGSGIVIIRYPFA